jgi:cyclophilin family peptidyl-prolyl cis-trans isomerase/HEAT repeat protein
MRNHRAVFAAIALLAAGCGGSSEKTAEPEDQRPVRTVAQEIADIQRLEDTRAKGEKLEPFLAHGDMTVRRRALLALGRIGDPKSVDAVARLLGDPETKVVEDAVFALGLIGTPGIAEPLRPALKSPEPEVRALALQALSRANRIVDLGTAAKMVQDPSARVRGEVGMAVTRMASKAATEEDRSNIAATVLALKPLLHDPDAAVRYRTAFALSRVNATPLKEELAGVTTDQDPLVRAFATKALGKLPGAPVSVLARSAGDSDPRVAWEGVDALSRCEGDGVVEALEKAASGGESVTVARAIEQLGLRMKATPGTLKAASRHPSPGVRAAALCAKAFQGKMEAWDDAMAALKSGEESMRRAGARALVMIGTEKAKEEVTRVLLGTEHVLHLEVLSGIKEVGAKLPKFRGEWDGQLATALDIPDPMVRAMVADALDGRDGPEDVKWDDILKKAYGASSGAGMADAREGILAWFESVARGREVALEGTKDESFAVRVQAVKTLRAAGIACDDPVPPAAGPIEPTKLEEIGFSMIVKLETTRGDIRIRMLPAAAPAMASTFVRLVKSGFYDGKRWHRVVPNFVIQGGDPRGDGTGDAGFTIRDEYSREPFDAGAVGMATSGKDTGSCQLFIMSAPAPHLDGRYTVFARLESGMDVVRSIEVGDRIVKATVDR